MSIEIPCQVYSKLQDLRKIAITLDAGLCFQSYPSFYPFHLTFAVKELWESLPDHVKRGFFHGYSHWSMAYQDTRSAPEHLKDIGQDLKPLPPLNPSLPPAPNLFLLTPHCQFLHFHHRPLLPFPSGQLNHAFCPGGLFRVQDLVTATFSQSSSAQSRVTGRMKTKGRHSFLFSGELFFCFVSLLMTK